MHLKSFIDVSWSLIHLLGFRFLTCNCRFFGVLLSKYGRVIKQGVPCPYLKIKEKTVS